MKILLLLLIFLILISLVFAHCGEDSDLCLADDDHSDKTDKTSKYIWSALIVIFIISLSYIIYIKKITNKPRRKK